MTRAQVKALRRLVKAEADLQGFIDRLSIDRADGAVLAHFSLGTKSKGEWTEHDWFTAR